MGERDADPTLIFGKLVAWLDGFFKLLPNIGVAFFLMYLFWLLARGIFALDRRYAGGATVWQRLPGRYGATICAMDRGA